MRRERRANPTVEMLLAGDRFDRSTKSPDYKRAQELWNEYKSKGASWSECVHAVKSNWINQLKSKYQN